jgi:hypothetical protein
LLDHLEKLTKEILTKEENKRGKKENKRGEQKRRAKEEKGEWDE